ncbi:MerR family transcriptional regulator [Pseudomonas sp.]|uniref:MerR family transcriptional regulator n=1 Tax=Pseudomonas sp. TaxID=306 RepID=UPI00272A2035|nr:MerR family transcriptional regulator [Pseudomonas sp.]
MTDHSPGAAPPDADLDLQDLYPIREVSRLTGVNPVTLRAWERRYGLLSPHRTESGHRLYSMADVERVRAVTAWIDRGVAVSKVATIIDRQVSQPRAAVEASAAAVVDDTAASAEPWKSRVVAAVNAFDIEELDRIHGQLHAVLPLPVVYAEVLLPVWRQYLGQSEPPSVQWQFLDSFLRERAFQRLGYLRSGQPRVLLASLPGPQRELEVLVAAIGIASIDAQIILVPAPVDLSDIQYLAERCQCDAVVLYGEKVLDTATLARHLPRLEQALECPLAVLGSLCEIQQEQLERARIICLGGVHQPFGSHLKTLLDGRLDTEN